MTERLEMALEAERRGISLPLDAQTMLSEARQRGLIPGTQEPSVPIDPAGANLKAPYPTETVNSISPARNVVRQANVFSEGALDSLSSAAGAVPDLVADGMRYVGLPAPREGYYADNIRQGVRTVGEIMSDPVTRITGKFGPPQMREGDKVAYGAGKGAGTAASMIMPAAALSKAAGLTGKVAKAVKTQPVMQTVAAGTGGAVTEATQDPWAGLAAALAVPIGVGTVGRVVSPIKNSLNANERMLAQSAERMGIPLTAGQKTGSRPLQAVESSFTQMPFTSGSQQAIYGNQKTAFNREVLRHAGINADNASPAVMSHAYDDIGREFDDLVKQTGDIVADKSVVDDVLATGREYFQTLRTDVRAPFKSIINDIEKLGAAVDQGKVFIDAKVYQRIASKLRRMERGATNDPGYREALGSVREAFDDLMERNAGPQIAAAWRDVRNRYRNLKIIDDAVSGGSAADRSAGDIPLAALTSAVRRSDKAGYSRGRGDLNEIARLGDFLAPRIPNSGTAERSMIMGALRGAPVTGAAGGVLAGGDPFIAGGSALAAYGLPPAIQRIMNSGVGQRYLTNQTAPRMGPKKELLAKILLQNTIQQQPQK